MARLNQKLADSLNVMYQDVVNKHMVAQINTPEYIAAEDFVTTHYPKLNEGVMEYLAAYMCVYPNGTIQFMPAKNLAVDLACRYDDTLKVVSYNENGIIVRDEECKLNQKGE